LTRVTQIGGEGHPDNRAFQDVNLMLHMNFIWVFMKKSLLLIQIIIDYKYLIKWVNININLEFLEEKKDNYGIQEKLLLFDEQEYLLFVIQEMKEIEWKYLQEMEILLRKFLFVILILLRDDQ
jgi:hypothetical protein